MIKCTERESSLAPNHQPDHPDGRYHSVLYGYEYLVLYNTDNYERIADIRSTVKHPARRGRYVSVEDSNGEKMVLRLF